MISFSCPTSPHCLSEFAAMDPPPAFNAPAFNECKHRVRELLLENQSFQCAYCESPIEDEPGRFHLDHMQPQGAAPQRRFDIANLVASCESKDTCGHNHGDSPVPEGLNPYFAEDLHLAFQCDSLGELYSNKVSDDLQKFAFENLNLNAIALKTTRVNVLAKLRLYTNSAGTNARRKLKNLSSRRTGFRSLYYQEFNRFGFPISS